MSKSIKCFVIMPIGDPKQNPETHSHYLNVFNNVILDSVRLAGEKLGVSINCIRASDINESGAIMGQVIEKLVGDDIVIADLSSCNANVFYELGIRHTFFKRSILITDGKCPTPFDVGPYRALRYEYPIIEKDSYKEFQTKLINYIQEILDNSSKPDNPVWDKADQIGGLIINSQAKIVVNYELLHDENGKSHEYLFRFGVENMGKKAFNNVQARIYFPARYLKGTQTNLGFLQYKNEGISGCSYSRIDYNFHALPEKARGMYQNSLLPGNTHWILGSIEEQATNLKYYVDGSNRDYVGNDKVIYSVNIDGGTSIKGEQSFQTLNNF